MVQLKKDVLLPKQNKKENKKKKKSNKKLKIH